MVLNSKKKALVWLCTICDGVLGGNGNVFTIIALALNPSTRGYTLISIVFETNENL